MKKFSLALQTLVASIFPGFLVTVGAVDRSLIYPELKKAFLAALGSSTIVGALVVLLQDLAGSAPGIFLNPYTAALISFILVHLAAQIALYGTHDPVPQPLPRPQPQPLVPAPSPTPGTVGPSPQVASQMVEVAVFDPTLKPDVLAQKLDSSRPA